MLANTGPADVTVLPEPTSETVVGGAPEACRTVQAEDAVYAVRNTTQQRDFQSFRDIFDRYLQQQSSLDDVLYGADAPLMTEFSDLDELLGGVQRSDLVILAARPSVGKSTLALNVAMHNAKSGCHSPRSLDQRSPRTLTHPGRMAISSNIRSCLAGQAPPLASSSALCGESRSR